MSVGDGKAQRKKRPRILAITTRLLHWMRGSPACIEYCRSKPVCSGCRTRSSAFRPHRSRSISLHGCQKCTSKGPDGAFLDGLSVDAIE